MTELKTKRSDVSVEKFLNDIADDSKRQEAWTMLELMQKITRTPPKMWGTNIVGFGSYHHKYADGHEGDSFLAGFSPRAQNLTLYLSAGLEPYEALLQQLGKYKTGKDCVYIKSLDDINLPTLKELIKQSFQQMQKTNHGHRPKAA
jgi:hypothetical protein